MIGLVVALQIVLGVGEASGQCLAPPDAGPFLGARLNLTHPRWLAWRTDTLRVVPRGDTPSGSEIITTAREFLGVPYVWGGVGKGGYDCSSFVNKVFAENGYDLPRVSRDQFRIGVKARRYDLEVGDLVFFVSKPGETRITHVGIYVGEDEFIHAAAGKGRVTFDRLSAGYYAARFAGGRRILEMPPGRYSTSWGAAPKNMLFEGANSVPTNWDPLLSELGLHGSGDGGGGGISSIPTEHAGEARPLQFTSSFLKGALTHLGPRLATPEETAVGIRIGGGVMNGEWAVVLSPEFSYFGHDNALELNLSAPLRVPVGTGNRPASEQWRDGWTEAFHLTKVLRELKFGQKESNLYVDLSRTLSGSLGHGQVMRYFTPNVENNYFPEYDVRVDRPDKLSLSFDTYMDWAGTEIFVDDVMEPHVFGALVFMRPSVFTDQDDSFLKRLSLGATYAVDRDAPYEQDEEGNYSRESVHALGLDVEFKLFRSDFLDIKPYVDISGLLSPASTGFGGAVGTLVRANLVGRGTHVLRFRLEGRLSQANYIPSYFDMTYALYRWRFPVDGGGSAVTTKLGLLEELEAESKSRWGVYSELVYRLHRRASFMISYEDNDTVGTETIPTRFSGRNFAIMGELRDFYIPGTRYTVDFYLAYHLRNISTMKPFLSAENQNEYLFTSASVQVSRYLYLEGSVRKALALGAVDGEDGGASTGVDGVLGAVLRYEL